jgi:hypothetical protein
VFLSPLEGFCIWCYFFFGLVVLMKLLIHLKKKNTKSMITKSKRHGTLYQIKDGFSISHLKRPKYKREVKPIFDRVKPKIENQEGPLALLPSH